MISSGQPQAYVGRIIYRNHLTPDLAILRMQPEDRGPIPDFKAGQFIALGFRFTGEDRIIYRAYSISSPPEEKRYFEFYIKWATEPIMGKITSALFNMKSGDILYWRKPAGAFTIEDKKADGSIDDRRLVLVASGTGVAPFISYLLHLKSIGSSRKMVLLHGVRYAKELGYREILEKMTLEDDFKYLPTVSRPADEMSKGWNGSTGRVETLLASKGSSSQLEDAVGEKVTPENSFFHICGYQGTIDAVTSILGPLGFVTNRSKRTDGSFDVKIETYGQ